MTNTKKLLIALALWLCCCSSNSVSSSNAIKENVPSPLSNRESSRDVTKKKQNLITNYEGCWSSYNGNWLIIEKGELMTSVNSFEPVKFEVLDYIPGSRTIILRLPNRPQHYFFQKIVKLELVANESDELELRVANFDTMEQLKQGTSLGKGNWVRDTCKAKEFDRSKSGVIEGSGNDR